MSTPSAQQFLDRFSNDPSFFIPLESLFEVTFIKAPNITSNLVPPMYGQAGVFNGGSVSSSSRYLAQSVNIPEEQIDVSAFEVSPNGNSGGYLAGYGLAQRSTGFMSLAINFIETEVDIVDTYFRLWTIAIGRKGLITDNDLKGDVVIKQYNTNGGLRKTFKYTEVFPHAVEAQSLNYDTDDSTLRIKSVTFGYENYSVY